MNLIALFALVTVSFGGTVSINQNLSAHECEEAKHVALFGDTLEQRRDTEIRALRDWMRAWRPNMPKAWGGIVSGSPPLLGLTNLPSWTVVTTPSKPRRSKWRNCSRRFPAGATAPWR